MERLLGNQSFILAREKVIEPLADLVFRSGKRMIKSPARVGIAAFLAGAEILSPDPINIGQAAIQEALNNLRRPGRVAAAGNYRAFLPEVFSEYKPAGASVPVNGTPTPTVIPDLTSAVGPVTFNYDVAPGVPNADVELIRAGISLAQAELQSQYGGDIQRPVNNPLTVKIVTDNTSMPSDANDGCCLALNESGARPLFNVMSSSWRNMYLGDTGRRLAAAHEYTHAWQNSLGCLTLHNQPLPDWLSEGAAEYIPHQNLIRSGALNTEAMRYFYYLSAKGTGQLSVSLQSLEHPPHVWPGHVGYLAVDRLVSQATSGHLSLRKVCESIASGSSADQTFQGVFGQSRTNFYENFPAYIESLKSSPVYLSLAGRLPPGTDPSRAEYKFNYAAYGYENLTSEQQFAAWGLPPEMCGWGSNLIGEMNIALCNAAPGTYPISLQLPDGRRSQVEITHSR